MRRLTLALGLLAVLPGISAESAKSDIRLHDGEVLRAARIVLISGDKVTITHEGGMTVVSADAVPLDILARAHERLSAAASQREEVLAQVTRRDAAQLRDVAGAALASPVPKARDRISTRLNLRATNGQPPNTTPENGCVIATNAAGKGTGFVLKQSDGFVLVSNQHVIDGAAPHRYELPGAKVIKPTGGFLAMDRDIVVFDLQESSFAHYFEMEPNVDAVALDEELIIYGNSSGEGVRISKARLVAKSSINIELSGGIVNGNSGGPIVRAKTGRVIGVSTFVRVRGRARSIEDLIEDAALPKVQFYGVRIDTLQKTTSFDLGRFVAEATNLQADEERIADSTALIALMLVKQLRRPDAGLQRMASKAKPPVHQLLALAHANPVLFRQRVEQLLAPISTASSFIHAENRERLTRWREILMEAYRDLKPVRY